MRKLDLRLHAWTDLLGLLSLVFCLSCATGDSANLLNVLDVVPRDVEVGDQIEVIGAGLPSGNTKNAHITFRGTLHRPGEDPITDKTILVSGAKPSPDRVTCPRQRHLTM